MYEKQCAMHTLYDRFVNECDHCVLFVYYRFLQLSSQILPRIRSASLRQTKLSFNTQNYNLRNPTMQLPRIKHEFPKQSLRYKLITTLNITPNETIEVAKTQSQQNLINLARANIMNGYSATCNLLICNVCTK